MAPPAPGTIQRVDYLFADIADLLPAAAWSETFYVQGDNASVFEKVTDDTDINVRRAILHRNYALAEIRVGDVVVLRDSNVFLLPPGTGTGTYPIPATHTPTDDDSEEPWDGILIECQDALLRSRRSFAMRGLPTDVVKNNFQYVGNPIWNPRIRAWGERHITTPGAPGPATPYLLQQRAFVDMPPPDTIAVGVDGRSLVLTWTAGRPASLNAQFGIVNGPGAFVSLSNVYGADFVNTIWRIKRLDGANVAHTVRHKRQIFTPGLGGAYSIQLVSYNYPPIAYATVRRGCKRNTGGPSARLHGRAPTR